MFFLNMILWRSKNRQTAPEALAVCIEGMVGNLGERNIRRCLDQGEDLHRMALDPCLAAVPALHPRFTGAGASPVPHQLDCCRWRHTEPSGSAPTTHIMPSSSMARMMRRRRSDERGLARRAPRPMPGPQNRRPKLAPPRNRRMGTTTKRRRRPHQMDAQNRQSQSQNGPRLSKQLQRVIIIVTRY